jgi:hypothetical protein
MQYGLYDSDGWWERFGDWTFGTGRWSTSPRAAKRSLDATSFSPAPSHDSLENPSNPNLEQEQTATTSTRIPSPGKQARMPAETIAVELSDLDIVKNEKPLKSAISLSTELHKKVCV